MIDMGENDFGVILRPTKVDEEDDGSSWGSVEVAVFSGRMPDIDDEAHAQYMFLAYKMAAMLEFCEDNPDFDDMLTEHTSALVEELGLLTEEPYEIKPKAKVTSKIGNVITLDFDTVCEGEG